MVSLVVTVDSKLIEKEQRIAVVLFMFIEELDTC